MMKINSVFSVFFLFLLVTAGLSSSPVRAEDTKITYLEKTEDIQDAESLQNSFKSFLDTVVLCTNNQPEKAIDCQCENTESINTFISSYSKTLEKHPDWAQQTVDYQKGNAGAQIPFPILMQRINMFRDLPCAEDIDLPSE
ncbi:MAG: hypothetical protein H6858_05310 [Rhodospirillales bacterium]|nr:hypothetical protein [Alphaproteobacteria bacterium]MCB1838881.1 hypothetical protein [Alphaproteobacteria bacterium]MCB9976994.1 hypothetical protein [Rhodospirillales bacterium]